MNATGLHKNALLFTLALLLVFASCNNPRQDNEAAAEEVTEAQIEKLALERGKLIAEASQATLSANLKNAVQRGGIAEAFSFCNIRAMPLTDSLSRQYNSEIKRATIWPRNPADKASTIEKQVIEAYDHQLKDGIAPEPKVINLDEAFVLYTQPIVINNGLCLNCHGEAGTQVQSETLALIQEKYPEDGATGHKMGDLRGIWSIRLAKSSLKNDVMGMLE
jgi:hypothetical protein